MASWHVSSPTWPAIYIELWALTQLLLWQLHQLFDLLLMGLILILLEWMLKVLSGHRQYHTFEMQNSAVSCSEDLTHRRNWFVGGYQLLCWSQRTWRDSERVFWVKKMVACEIAGRSWVFAYFKGQDHHFIFLARFLIPNSPWFVSFSPSAVYRGIETENLY